MASPPSSIHTCLRVIQVTLSLIVLFLSSYNQHWTSSSISNDSFPNTIYPIVVSNISLFSAIYLAIAPRLGGRPEASHPFSTFLLVSFNGLLYTVAFIALAVQVSKESNCDGWKCSTTKADVGVAAPSYAAWTLQAVFLGVELRSKRFEKMDE